MSHKFKLPKSITNGFMFPNVTHIKIMQRSTGSVVHLTLSELKEKIRSAQQFENIKSDIFLTGEYIDSNYHILATKQGSTGL